MDKLEDTHVSQMVKEACDIQINDVTSDIHLLLEDTKMKIEDHLKQLSHSPDI